MSDLWIDFIVIGKSGQYKVCNDSNELRVEIDGGSPLRTCLYDARELAKVLDCKLFINGLEDDGMMEAKYLHLVSKKAEVFSTDGRN